MKKIIKNYNENDLTLRLLSENDLQHTLNWRNYDLHRQWFTHTDKITPKEHLEWYKDYEKNENDLIFIATDNIGTLYGQLSIYEINWKEKTATFGRFLANPEYTNRGFMKKACKCGINLAKNILHLKKLTLEVKKDNQRAIHIYTICEFSIYDENENNMLFMKLNL